MPELAKELIKAGCDDERILKHCRKKGSVHVRGCWVLDGLLGQPRLEAEKLQD
jgi:hypothetical protein